MRSSSLEVDALVLVGAAECGSARGCGSIWSRRPFGDRPDQCILCRLRRNAVPNARSRRSRVTRCVHGSCIVNRMCDDIVCSRMSRDRRSADNGRNVVRDATTTSRRTCLRRTGAWDTATCSAHMKAHWRVRHSPSGSVSTSANNSHKAVHKVLKPKSECNKDSEAHRCARRSQSQ